MLSVPKQEPIDDVYKSTNLNNMSNSKKRQSIKKLQVSNDKYTNNYFNNSKSNDLSRQRRQSFYNLFPLSAENIEQIKKVNPIVKKIMDYENTFVGFSIIIIIGIFSILLYDLKNTIPERDEMIYLIILGVLTLYHIIMLIIEIMRH